MVGLPPAGSLAAASGAPWLCSREDLGSRASRPVDRTRRRCARVACDSSLRAWPAPARSSRRNPQGREPASGRCVTDCRRHPAGGARPARPGDQSHVRQRRPRAPAGHLRPARRNPGRGRSRCNRHLRGRRHPPPRRRPPRAGLRARYRRSARGGEGRAHLLRLCGEPGTRESRTDHRHARPRRHARGVGGSAHVARARLSALLRRILRPSPREPRGSPARSSLGGLTIGRSSTHSPNRSIPEPRDRRERRGVRPDRSHRRVALPADGPRIRRLEPHRLPGRRLGPSSARRRPPAARTPGSRRSSRHSRLFLSVTCSSAGRARSSGLSSPVV